MIKKTFSVIVIFTLLFLYTIKGFTQDSTNISKKYFGLSLQPNFQGLISYAIIEVSEKNGIKKVYLSRRDWLHQIVGIQQSVANIEEKNILKDAGLDGPDILDEVWKLRYAETPYAGSSIEKGWAGKSTFPSEGQMQMLGQFGIKTIGDFFYGENLLKLLKAMEDPGWVAEYQNK